jgi:hypothetical protein
MEHARPDRQQNDVQPRGRYRGKLRQGPWRDLGRQLRRDEHDIDVLQLRPSFGTGDRGRIAMKLVENLVVGVGGIALAILWLAGQVPLGWWAFPVCVLAGIGSLAKAIVELDARRSRGAAERDDES